MKHEIPRILCQLGLYPSSISFWYLLSALDITQQDPQALTSLTKRVYAAVASDYAVTPGAVESGLRRAVLTCWNAMPSVREEVLGPFFSQRPTVGQFLAVLSRSAL